MHSIITTTTTHGTAHFIENGEFLMRPHWQHHCAADYLKFFLLANFPVRACDAGMADEPHKILQYYGQTVWEEGQTKVKFWGKTFEVVSGQ